MRRRDTRHTVVAAINTLGRTRLPASGRKEPLLGELEGEFAFSTDAGRGQGGCHAISLGGPVIDKGSA